MKRRHYASVTLHNLNLAVGLEEEAFKIASKGLGNRRARVELERKTGDVRVGGA